MEDYWLSNSESSEAFWEHEWSTHGTCVSTLEPSCYSSYTTGQEAADYFQIVVDLFKTLDTYTVSLDAQKTQYEKDASIDQSTDSGQRWYHTFFVKDVHLGSNHCCDQG